jgi:predicted nucleic acid-binding protein
MTYLVDANVLSEAVKPQPAARVLDWLTANESDFVIDAVILGELAIGILSLPRGRKRSRLETWFAAVSEHIDCLPWDAAISQRWAQLVADLRRKGQSLPIIDSMIAATALTHGLTVATHNVRDFRKAGVPVLDPFA